MPYYVVNVGQVGRTPGTGTHIMRSGSPSILLGKPALCGRNAIRVVDVFTPAEASCRECKKRYQLAVQAEADKAQRQADKRAAEAQRRAALTPEQRAAEDRRRNVKAAVVCVVSGAACYGLWLASAAVNAACMRPYAECAANGRLGQMLGGLVLIALTAAAGLVSLIALVLVLAGLSRRAEES